jgi:hypothetical protein
VVLIRIIKYAPIKLAVSNLPIAGINLRMGRTNQFVTAKTNGPSELPEAGLREIFWK